MFTAGSVVLPPFSGIILSLLPVPVNIHEVHWKVLRVRRCRPYYCRRTSASRTPASSLLSLGGPFLRKQTVLCSCRSLVFLQAGDSKRCARRLYFLVDPGYVLFVLREQHSWYWQSLWHLLEWTLSTSDRYSTGSTDHSFLELVLNNLWQQSLWQQRLQEAVCQQIQYFLAHMSVRTGPSCRDLIYIDVALLWDLYRPALELVGAVKGGFTLQAASKCYWCLAPFLFFLVRRRRPAPN